MTVNKKVRAAPGDFGTARGAHTSVADTVHSEDQPYAGRNDALPYQMARICVIIPPVIAPAVARADTKTERAYSHARTAGIAPRYTCAKPERPPASRWSLLWRKEVSSWGPPFSQSLTLSTTHQQRSRFTSEKH